MIKEVLEHHDKENAASMNCSVIKKIFTLLLLFISVQAWGQKHVFRPEPNFNSQPDATSDYMYYEFRIPHDYEYILEYIDNEWVKVQRTKFVRKQDKNGKYLGTKTVRVAEYIDLESLNPYVIKDGGEIRLHSRPEINSPEVLSIDVGDGFGVQQTYANLPDNDERNDSYNISGVDYDIISSTKQEWIKFRAIISLLPRGKDYDDMNEKERKEYVENLRNLRSINDTIYGYVNRQSFETNMELQPVYVPTMREKISDYVDDISNEIEDFFEYRINLNDNFHIWILILLVLNIIVLVALDSYPKVQFILDYSTLLSIFILELVYIALLESEFWWCSPSQVGWIKAILFFILTLALAVYQFFRFFHMLDQIIAKSKPFNTFIGITLFTVIAIVMFIYAIFAGGLDDHQNQTLINILIATQVLQIIITTIQLRKYPLYALLVLLLIPIGTFAVLLSFLRLFAFLCFFGLIAYVFYCWATSSGAGSGGKSGRKRGDAQHCPHFNNHYCTFGGHNHSCSLLRGSKCRHGQF